MAESNDDMRDLDVVITWRDLPGDIARQREEISARYERETQALEPLFNYHLATYGAVLDVVESHHRTIGDGTDLDMGADTRQAAVWIVAGRCIGFNRAVLSLLEAGFGAESVAVERALHEATRLLGALADASEPEMIARWLDDEDKHWVRPWETREALVRLLGRVREHMIALKDEADAQGDAAMSQTVADHVESEAFRRGEEVLKANARQVYDALSRIGHSRRSGIRDAVSPGLRQMATGPHPNPSIRSDYIEFGGQITEEAVMAVGDALARFHQPGWFEEHIKPLVSILNDVRVTALAASCHETRRLSR